MRKIIFCSLAAICIWGCSGRLSMTNIPLEQIQKPGWSVDGVIGYQPVWFLELYQFTKPIEDGKTEVGPCTPVPAPSKLALHADTQHPILIKYEHGLLESYTFGVTLAG